MEDGFAVEENLSLVGECRKNVRSVTPARSAICAVVVAS